MNKFDAERYFSGPYIDAAQAIADNDMRRLRQVVTHRIDDVDAPGEQEMTLMWFAFQAEKPEAIRTLMELGSKPYEQKVEGLGTPLYGALRHQDTRYLKAMLEGGLDPNHASRRGTPILHEAAGPAGRTLEHVKLLVEAGADVDGRSSLWATPLLRAIDTSNVNVAEYLVEQGADVNAFTRNGDTMMRAVHLIIERQQPGSPMRQDYERLRDLMIEKGAEYPPPTPKEVRARARAQGIENMIGD